MSRPGSDDFVRLVEHIFGELCQWAEETVTMDLMATPASVHKKWDASRCTDGCGSALLLSVSHSRLRRSGCTDARFEVYARVNDTRVFRVLFPTSPYGRSVFAAPGGMPSAGSRGGPRPQAILVSAHGKCYSEIAEGISLRRCVPFLSGTPPARVRALSF